MKKSTHTFKTSVELEHEKVMIAKKLSNAPTLKKLLDEALDSYIAQARRQQMAGLLGTGFFEGGLAALKKSRGSSHR